MAQVMWHLPGWRTANPNVKTSATLKSGEVVRYGDLITLSSGEIAPALAADTVGTTTAILGVSLGDSAQLVASQGTATPTIPYLVADDELEVLLPLVNSTTNKYDKGTWAASLMAVTNYKLTRQAAANTFSAFTVDIVASDATYPMRIVELDTAMTAAVLHLGWHDNANAAYSMVWCKFAVGNRIGA